MDVKHTAAAVVQQESVQLLQLHQIVPKIIVKHFGTGRIKPGKNAVRPIQHHIDKYLTTELVLVKRIVELIISISY